MYQIISFTIRHNNLELKTLIAGIIEFIANIYPNQLVLMTS